MDTGNAAVGVGALNSLTTGFENGCIGDECGVAMTTGYKNWGSGAGALANVTSGYQNTGDGVGACSDIQASAGTTCLGYLAGSSIIGTYSSLPNGMGSSAPGRSVPAANGGHEQKVIGNRSHGPQGNNSVTLGNAAMTSAWIYGVPTIPSLGGSGTGCIGINNSGGNVYGLVRWRWGRQPLYLPGKQHRPDFNRDDPTSSTPLQRMD